MSFHPAPRDSQTGMNRRQIAEAQKAEAATMLELHRYMLGAQFRAQISIYDTQALGDANRAAVSEEIELLEYGLRRAGSLGAGVEIVARASQRMALLTDRQIIRRFGN